MKAEWLIYEFELESFDEGFFPRFMTGMPIKGESLYRICTNKAVPVAYEGRELTGFDPRTNEVILKAVKRED